MSQTHTHEDAERRYQAIAMCFDTCCAMCIVIRRYSPYTTSHHPAIDDWQKVTRNLVPRLFAIDPQTDQIIKNEAEYLSVIYVSQYYNDFIRCGEALLNAVTMACPIDMAKADWQCKSDLSTVISTWTDAKRQLLNYATLTHTLTPSSIQ